MNTKYTLADRGNVHWPRKRWRGNSWR